jgi:hypothetical protein
MGKYGGQNNGPVMIYRDWEEGYEKLPALSNAMKAANPGMHYEYMLSGGFHSVWRPSGIVFRCYPLMVLF